MSSSGQLVEEDSQQWDYLCPQFVDFNAKETTDQLKEMDHFFEVDHELKEEEEYASEDVVKRVTMTPIIDNKSKLMSAINDSKGLSEANDYFTYETPPQNKENVEEEDNEVFYSTKKYLSDQKKYKFRSTPMRTLQYNGMSPLRESRFSSKKKKRNGKSNSTAKRVTEESLFAMQPLLEALPFQSNASSSSIDGSQPNEDVLNDAKLETRIDIEEEVISEVITDQQNEQLIDNEEPNGIENEMIEIENEENSDKSNDKNRRESYVIEKVPKTVTVVSPLKSSKMSFKKRFSNSIRRKGTPIRRSVLSSNRKVSTQSIVSRLYSTAKKSQNGYKSMAELLKEFETKPRGCDRSRSLDRGTCSQRSRSSSVSSLTRPKSPKLHSIQRHRQTPRPTEDIIASQIKKYSFKANPIRKKLFDANFASGIPRVKSSKAPTKAVPMNFETEKRHELWATKHSNGDKPEGDHKFKANPMPAFKIPKISLTKSEKKPTLLKPFSFDDKIQNLVTKKRTLSEDNIKRDNNSRNTFRF